MKPRREGRTSICIPAWQSRPFIERTLDFALGQSCRDIDVLVSVDQCDDGTLEACRARAESEPRLKIFAQQERLGWAGNVNFLLDQVETEFFFLYFHDDIIAPQYVDVLLEALQSHPEAASVHCDMGHFGANDHVSTGFDYVGAVEARLAAFLLAPQRGSPLRSLTRSVLLDTPGLRLPTDAAQGLWANEPYLMGLVSAAPARRVPRVLYHRWDKRQGGLTDGWKQLSPEQVFASYAANTASFMGIIESSVADPNARRGLAFCLYLHQALRLQQLKRTGVAIMHTALQLHPAFPGLRVPDLEPLGAQPLAWAESCHARLSEADRIPC
jgi:glycosyltransferase involved in cell wall biosynthesis